MSGESGYTHVNTSSHRSGLVLAYRVITSVFVACHAVGIVGYVALRRMACQHSAKGDGYRDCQGQEYHNKGDQKAEHFVEGVCADADCFVGGGVVLLALIKDRWHTSGDVLCSGAGEYTLRCDSAETAHEESDESYYLGIYC